MGQVAGKPCQRPCVACERQQLSGHRSFSFVVTVCEHDAEVALTKRDQHIFEYAHMFKQQRRLIGACDAGPRNGVRRFARDHFA